MAHTYATPAALITISILFPLLGIITVLLRIYTRRQAGVKLWVDDWMAILALLLEFVLGGLIIWGAKTKSLGELLPPPYIPGPKGFLFVVTDQQTRLLQIQYFFSFIGVFAFGFLKLSILFFYRKVFTTRVSRSSFDKVNTIVVVFVSLWTLGFGIGAVFICKSNPKSGWGSIAELAEKCPAQLQFTKGYAISDFILDLVIWALPVPKIWTLNMSLRRKLEVSAVFLVGLLTIAASAARMGIYIKYTDNAYADSDGETLVTYLVFWTMIECGLGVIVVCLPTLRSLYRKMIRHPNSSGIKSASRIPTLRSGANPEPGVYRLQSIDEPAKAYMPSHDFRS